MNLRSSGGDTTLSPQGLGSSWLWKRGWGGGGDAGCQATPSLAWPKGSPALSSPPCLFPISTQPLAPYPQSPILCSCFQFFTAQPGEQHLFPSPEDPAVGEGGGLAVVASLLLPCSSGAERLAPV